MIEAHEISVASRARVLLEPTSLAVGPGMRILVTGEPGHGHAALALVVGGRMNPSSGHVLFNGTEGAARHRHAVALVDTPGVTDPDGAMPVGVMVAEELSMAGHRARRSDVAPWLARLSLTSGNAPVEQLDAIERTWLLTEIAALRPGVQALILTLPDRHGGNPLDWWALAGSLADRGLAVIVQSLDASAQVIGTEAIGFEPIHLARHGEPRSAADLFAATGSPIPTTSTHSTASAPNLEIA